MTLEEIQKRNKRQDAITRLIAGLIRFTLTPLLLMLWYYIIIVIPFGQSPLSYLQAFLLMFGINLIKKL